MNLAALRVEPSAVVAKPVVICSWSPLVRWYVAARRTCTVVVIDTVCGWLDNLIDGIETSSWGHNDSSLGKVNSAY
jgi:hypothetical protein